MNENMQETLGKFWDQVTEVWENGLMGVDVGKIIIALAIFFGFLVIRGVFSKYVLYKLYKYAEKNDNKPG